MIKQLFAIDMPIRTVGEYLSRWGFRPQKSLRRAYEQNPKLVRKWLDEDYPAIAARAKKEDAEINWGDATGLCSDSQHGGSCAPRGRTSAVRHNAKKERVNLITSMTDRGKVRLMIYNRTMNSHTFIKFCKRLIKDAGKKVFLNAYLSRDLKTGVHSGAPARSKSDLKCKALSHLRMLQ